MAADEYIEEKFVETEFIIGLLEIIFQTDFVFYAIIATVGELEIMGFVLIKKHRVVNMVYWIWNNLGTCNMLESYTEEGVIIVDVRDLNDSAENTVEAVKKKITLVGNLLACGERVIVRCLAGMSRSNSIACGAMMLFTREHGWNHYWHVVEKACPRARQNLEFVDTVKKALEEIGVDKKRLFYDA
jgi:predicted protein tyrosine phosphatase